MITLYVKTHRQTGLKYFGKTTRDDPYRYKGSGTYWKLHIKKHGYDVETEIVGAFENIDEAVEFALRFSKENNIVESEKWANLQEENGLDGVLCGNVITDETRKKMSMVSKGKRRSAAACQRISSGRKGIYNPKSNEKKIGIPRDKQVCYKIAKTMATFWEVIDSYGNKQLVFNLKNFCRANNLDVSAMSNVARGKRKQHKGYKCRKVESDGQASFHF